MVTKKTAKKEEKKEEVKTEKESQYFYGLGKRKTAIAQVRIYPVEKIEKGIIVNGKNVSDYFTIGRHVEVINSPFLTISDTKFDVSAKVVGGGVNAQAEAIRLGAARAMVKFNPELKKQLRDRGFLTRDARIVERKKPGLKKARKSPQWAKR